MVKSQIPSGKRFKAGGIRFAETPIEAEGAAATLLGAKIREFTVDEVLVEERLEIDKEFYAGIIVNDSHRAKGPVLMFSTEGGVDIETVAETSPEKISSVTIDVLSGVRIYDAYDLILQLGVPNTYLQQLGTTLCNLYNAFRRYEARVAEVNPLALTKEGDIVACDCRIMIDDSAVFRHHELGIEIPRESARPPTALDRIAWGIEEGDYRGTAYFMQMVPEIKEPGYVGFHGIGGGGAMLGADALARNGLKIANYADTSGNPTAAKVYRIAKLILSQPGIEGYFLSGAVIASQEQWHHAHGLVKAFREDLVNRPGFPVLILIAGNKEKEAVEILNEGLSDLPIRLEVYGRDYVYRIDDLAERMRQLVEKYRMERKGDTNV